MPLYSIIIPLFNRPDEIKELLDSLCLQDYKDFELIVVEDGSSIPSEKIVLSYSDRLNVKYYAKPNSGPGPTRNYGAKLASGNYFIFFDSDCLIPATYLSTVNEAIRRYNPDAFGGPDKAHPSFTPIQKAISYAMTSFFTTGGIRGGKEKLDRFHPRSFNMGLSRKVFDSTQGFSEMRFGEDVDLSLRILENGFSTRLIPDAFVFHKRRTDFKKFFKQVHNSGIARINLFKRHPESLKLVHFLPSVFTTGTALLLFGTVFYTASILPLLLFMVLIFTDSARKEKSVKIGFLSIIASFVQLIGYGTGFIRSFWNRLILNRGEFHAFKKNFYK